MRIAIANASKTAADCLRRALFGSERHSLSWNADSLAQAARLCVEDPPDMLLMDLSASDGSGADAALRVLKPAHCVILVLVGNFDRQASEIYALMEAGAAGWAVMPGLVDEEGARELLRKIDAIGKRAKRERGAPPDTDKLPAKLPAPRLPPLVVMGASTGGPNALAAVLTPLPASFPAAILIVQHVDQQFAGGIARWLGQSCRLPVDIARVADRPQAGRVLMACSNDHMVLTADQAIAYVAEPLDNPYRPSADVFFDSVARHWPKPAVAVLLTGMGRDGAQGLLKLRQAGWFTIAQDQQSCAVYGMPKAAAELGAAMRVLPPPRIAQELIHCLQPANGGFSA